MDISFHLNQGKQLLAKLDVESLKKALAHFKSANEMTGDNHIVRPKTLYHLALGNFFIGQIEQSYKIAHKAKRSIDVAIENSMLSMNNMRQMLGEKDIDDLIQHINENFSQVAVRVDTDDDDFDENYLDFSLLYQMHPYVPEKKIEPEFSIENLDDEVFFATYYGLIRTSNELIYFDKLKGDVLSYAEGYFSSHLGDQTVANKLLAKRITNREPIDFVDEERYILIDILKLTDFLNEFKIQSNSEEPFNSFVDFFSEEILKEFTYDLSIDDLANSKNIQKKFHELFNNKYKDSVFEFRVDFFKILKNTQHALALKWIKAKVFNRIKIDEFSLKNMNVTELFKLRRKCAENRDIISLLSIAQYNFINGSAAQNETYLPELFYYYGRLHRFENLKEFFDGKEYYLFMLTDSCKLLAKNLLNIASKFPHLNEQEIAYLEQKYCDSKTFELFDIIMFDADKLSRPIKKFDKELLKIKNTEFSKDFLLNIYDCFSKNRGLDDRYSELFVYSRILNKIIRKKYECVGLGEYCIDYPILSNQFWNLMNNLFGDKCADDLIKKFCNNEKWEDFKRLDYYRLNSDFIEEVAVNYFSNPKQVEEVKTAVAKFWLDNVNSHDISLT